MRNMLNRVRGYFLKDLWAVDASSLGERLREAERAYAVELGEEGG